MVKELTRKMKDSGVEWIGEIPEDWEVVRNKNLFKNKKEIVGNEFETIDRLALTLKGVIDRDKLESGGLQPTNFNTYQKVNKNNLIFKLIDLENINTSRVGLAHKDGMVSPAYVVLYSNSLKKDIRYYHYFYLSMWHRNIFNMLGDGGVRSNLNKTDLLNLNTLKINYNEQKSIADFLDKKTQEIDNIISKTKKAIEEYKRYKQSLITETVTKGLDENVEMKYSGIEWIGEIPKHWGLERLKYSFLEHKSKNIGNKEKNVLSLSYGNIVKRNIKDNFGLLPESFESYNIVKPGVIVLRLTDLQNDKKSWRVGISKQIGIITSAYVSLLNKDKKNRYSPYYYYFIHSLDYKKVFYNLGDGVRQSMSYMDIGNIEIVIPPLKEQKQIANYLDNKCSQIDQIISTKEKFLREMEAYKKSLIYETVTGKREVE